MLPLWIALAACKPDPVDTGPGPETSEFVFTARVERTRAVSDRADQVVAIPHFRGSAAARSDVAPVTAAIAAEGTFVLTLDAKSDWSVFLVDATATDPRARVVAPIAIGLDDSELLSVVGDEVTGDIDAGTLVDGWSGVRTDTTTAEAATWFAFEPATLDLLGATDDVFLGLKNAAANVTSPDERYWSRVGFLWRDDLTDAHVTPATPPYTYFGFEVEIGATGGPLDWAAVSSGAQSAVLRPPGELVLSGEAFGPDRPIPARWAWAGMDGASVVAFTDPAPNLTDVVPSSEIPEGFWAFEVDGVEVATFELALAVPANDAGLPVGLYPTMSLDPPDTDGALSLARVGWRVRNALTDEDAAVDPADVAPVVSGGWFMGEAREEGLGDAEKLEFPGFADGVAPTSLDLTGLFHPTALPGVPAGSPVLTGLAGGATIGDASVRVTWRDQTCVDDDQDGFTRCVEGLEWDDEPTVYPHARERCGDGFDNGLEGDGDAVCTFDVNWKGPDVLPVLGEADEGQWGGFTVIALGETWIGTALSASVNRFSDGARCGYQLGVAETPDRALGTPTLSYTPYDVWMYTARGACDPFVTPYDDFEAEVLIRDGAGGILEAHGLRLPEVLATEDANNVLTAASTTAPSAPDALFELQLTGRATTSELIAITPFSTRQLNSWELTMLGTRIRLYDADTGAPLVDVCGDRDCTWTFDGVVDDQLAAWVPGGGDVRWEATIWLSWRGYFPNDTPITPLVWTEDGAGALRHTVRDAAWHALPNLPEPPAP